MIRKRKNKSHVILLGSLFVCCGIFCLSCKSIYDYYINKRDEKMIEDFFDMETSSMIPVIENIDDNIEVKETEKIIEEKVYQKENYIAVLEIPSINLKKGLYDISSNNNHVDKNIQIIRNSDMPNVTNGNFILAGHSGSGRTAFFKDLYTINVDDAVHVYYSGNKYSYKIVDKYIVSKNGTIPIYRKNDISVITLTTCDQQNKKSQIVLIGELNSVEKY